ncbi:MAG: type II toxin-antitoxin system HicB family antitoxin [Christensenellaceae bacterium]|nr:type II toxin-antitoxin system HicB family antitoxin [Christensenellaceae bacterium]
MLVAYPAVFHEEDGFWIEFPDLPGCQSEGDDINDAMANASEALGLFLCSLREREIKTPMASDIKTIKSPDDGFVTLISSDPEKYETRNKAVKKTLTIPSWLNDKAEKAGVNYSQVLQEALKNKLGVL